MTTGANPPGDPEPDRPRPEEPQPDSTSASQGPTPTSGEPSYPGSQGAPPPQMPPPPGPPPGMPRRAPPMREEDEKLWAIGAHLGPILIGVFAPLIVWLVFKDRSAFLDRQGKEALNMRISYLIYVLVAGLSLLVVIGVVLLPLVGIAWLVLMIIASVKAANYEDYRYPAIFRLVS